MIDLVLDTSRMPSEELQSSSPLALVSFIIDSDQDDLQQDPAASMQEQEDIAAYQFHVANLFSDLPASGDHDFLTLLWLRSLLDTFLLCQEEFRLILLNNRRLLSQPPMDRLISDFYDRSVKALDLCNAVCDGIDQIRKWEKKMEIVLIALDPRQDFISHGQIRRAKKALIDLALLLLDEKESSLVLVQKTRTFVKQRHSLSHHRSLSFSVSRAWSASKQLQAIGSNIYVPRSQEVVSTGGLANSVFTMNSLLHFAMWVLVAAVPCQDRSLQCHFAIPKSFPWGAAVISVHERIMEESKRRERKKSAGLLKEIHQLEKCTRHLLQLTESVDLFSGRKDVEMIREGVLQFGDVYSSMKDELEPLERQVRIVFHEIVRGRIEGLDCLQKQE